MKRILLQLDTDQLPSSFDAVVATDAGADELIRYGNVTVDNVEALVHGAIFTRKPDELKNTAIFIGGSDVEAAARVFKKVNDTFIGPMKVSVMLDPSGSNTTAAAAVYSASHHLSLNGSEALILGGTGPVGRRCAEILLKAGASVRLASRTLDRAVAACGDIKKQVVDAKVTSVEFNDENLAAAVDGVNLIIAAGAAGVKFLTAEEITGIEGLKVAIDLNAVPPVGLEGIDPTDRAKDLDGVICYGALGVGALKMKIHRAAIEKLFTSNDLLLDTAAIYELAKAE